MVSVWLVGCGGEIGSDEELAEGRLPHVEAPLDTVQVIETRADTGGVVVGNSGAAIAEPAWTRADLAGYPDPKKLHYVRYTNPPFNYSIAYPDTLLKPAGPIGETRGMEFSSTAGDVRMLVYAIETSTREDLNAQYQTVLEDPEVQVTYRARDEDSYIVAGRKGDEIFYEKSLSSEGMLKTFRIQYPVSKKAYFDAVTAMMSASFRG